MFLQRTVWAGCFVATAVALLFGITSAAQEKASTPTGQEPAWSLEGPWTGVAVDESKGSIYALGPRGRCVEMNRAGKSQREIKLPDGDGSILRLATLGRDGAKALLTFRGWGLDLRAYDLSGKQLWTYSNAVGINDAWASDLDGDGSDEVIVGYNGGAGVHVLDSKGQLLWNSTAIGNVWHVCAGDVLGEGKSQVVTTSAAGKVHVFDGEGKKRKDLDVGCYATMVRIGKPADKEKAATILAAGSALAGGAEQKFQILTALSGDGTKRWSLELPAGTPPHVDSAHFASGKPWLAVGMRGGQVHVVDINKGQIIARVNDQGLLPQVGWVKGDDAGVPLLLVATASKLNAFRVATSK